LGAETRAGRDALAARRSTSVVGPSGLEWRIRILRVPSAMKPPPRGRRYPPIVLVYAVRGHGQALAALVELTEALARGSGAPVLKDAERID
jgi:hypothetical protein